MKKIACTLLLLFFAASAGAQVRDPAVSRAWWPSVKRYIDASADGKTFTVPAPFTAQGYGAGHTTDTVAIFTPAYSKHLEAVSVFSPDYSLPDSTLYLVAAHGTRDTLVVIDSTGCGSVNYWTGVSGAEFSAAEPCTLMYALGSDSAYVAHPLIFIQWRNRED